jgi:hypothetical protein
MHLRTIITIGFVAAALAGCVTEETQRVEGVTAGAGNALAANTAMQMVDPWQYGVQDTDLDVPADRAGAVAAPSASSGDGSGASVDGGSSGAGSSE